MQQVPHSGLTNIRFHHSKFSQWYNYELLFFVSLVGWYVQQYKCFESHSTNICCHIMFQAPICVVGITCRLDVIELLEKRVKSRFSHRQIFLFSGGGQKEKSSFEMRMALLKSLLMLSEDEVCLSAVVFVHCWNSQVDDLCMEEPVRDVMRKMLSMDKSERTLRSFLVSRRCNKDVTWTGYFC